MLVRDFDFPLLPERIAQEPAPERDGARLYVLPLSGGATRHSVVSELPERLVEMVPEGALLVVNDTRVIPARLRGRKPSGGRVELLLVARRGHRVESDRWTEEWLCLGGSSKPIRPGLEILLDGPRPPAARVLEVAGQEVLVSFAGTGTGSGTGDEPGGLLAAAERLGEVPLPPYIRRPDGPRPDDAARYQTVYARVPGSVAAPTAGLHLTPALLDRLAARGIAHTSVTLHVGLGTFAPLALPDDAPIAAIGQLHAERFEVSAATASAVAQARAAGRRIVAVGTTTVRALESAALDSVALDSAALDSAALDSNRPGSGALRVGPGETRLFIGPGHRFRVVGGLLTNFHLPRSTLLMLVSALAGRDRLLAAYADAVARQYRFFSYGDAMLIA